MRRLWLPLPFALDAAALLETPAPQASRPGSASIRPDPRHRGRLHARGGHLRQRLLLVLAVAMLGGASPAAAAARDDAVTPLVRSERNFLALLRPVPGKPAHGFGVVRFRQPHDAQKVAFLDVWTLGLAPNHSYSLQRATDTTVDDSCTGTNWLTLGRGAEPQAIETNELGFGRAHLFRDLAAFPDGMSFDIQFRLIDSISQEVVLVSSCHQFTVSP
jgi:hypothetical protein